MKLHSLFISKTELYNVLSPNFLILVSASALYIPRIGLPILLQPYRQTNPGNILSACRYMNVGLRNKTAHFLSGNTYIGFLVHCSKTGIFFVVSLE